MRSAAIVLLVALLAGCLEPTVRTVYVKVPAWDLDGDPDREDLIKKFRLRYPLDESNTSYPSLVVPIPDNVTRLKFDVKMKKFATADFYLGFVRGSRHTFNGTDELGRRPVCYDYRGDRGPVITTGQETLVFRDQVIKARNATAGNLTFRIEGHGKWWVDVEIYSVGFNATKEEIDRFEQVSPSSRCDN